MAIGKARIVNFVRSRLLFHLSLGLMMLQAAPGPVPARGDSRAVDNPTRPAPTRTPADASSRAAAPAVPARAPLRKPAAIAVPVHTELDIPRWLGPGEYVWNDEGVPAGATTIVVNLKGRVMSVYRAGYEIGRSSIIYGADDKPTPNGVFPIMAKKARHVSSIYGTPMPFTLRLTHDGISIHAAKIADDLGTNGCVGLPHEFAELLFAAARVGDRVHIWDGTRTAT